MEQEIQIEELAKVAELRRAAKRHAAVQDVISEYNSALTYYELKTAGTRINTYKPLGISNEVKRLYRYIIEQLGDNFDSFHDTLNEWLATDPRKIHIRNLLHWVRSGKPEKTMANYPDSQDIAVIGEYTPPKYTRPVFSIVEINEIISKAHSGNPEATYALRKLQKTLSANMMWRSMVSDKDYLKYSPCVCCGSVERMPPDGHRLFLIEGEYNMMYKVPKCGYCIDMEEEIDWAKVASMYCNYATNLEYIFDKIS